MAYGLKYILNFDGGPQGAEHYTLEFYFKDYSGVFSNMIGVQAAVVQSWDKDEPKPGIKGSSLEMSLLNKSGSLPLSDFFAVTDDNCKVVYSWGSQVLFTCFLVQDDCREAMLDYSHPINLTATDNLGLLKDIPFNEANLIVGDGNRTTTGIQAYSVPPAPPAAGYLFIASIVTGALVGDTVIISGTPGSDGVYTIVNVVPLGAPGTAIYLDRPFPFAIPNDTIYTFTFITPADLRSRLSLAYIIRVCLYSTNLALYTDVYSTIIESVTTTNRFLEETFISGNDFSNGNNDFKSCYDVLNIIMERFNATLFQAEGVWNIIRRDEHRYYDNAIPGFRYDENMVYFSDITYDDIFTANPNIDPSATAPETFPVSGITKSILRPYKFDKETFNYKQPADLLCNFNLQKLGALITRYTSGTDTVYEYEMICWFDGLFAPFSDRFIRVTIDNLGNEVSRYAVISGPHGDSSRTAQSEAIEINALDKIKYSFSWRTDVSQPGNVNATFSIRITDGSTNLYLQADGSWDTPASFVYNVPSGDNTNIWHTVDCPLSAQIPFAGHLYIYLGGETANANDETWYKDLSLEYLFYVTDSNQIIGHTHTETQQPTIKNNEDVEIFIDDSPRNSINGTMFLSTFTGLIQDRTMFWGYAPAGTRRLGEITTFEQLFWRRIPRTKLEGTMYGIVQSTSRRYLVEQIWSNVDVPPLVSGVDLPAEIVAMLSPGSIFTIEGTASNDGTYTVISIGLVSPLFVEVAGPVTLEGPVTAYIIITGIRRHVSMLTLLRYTGLTGLNFIFGVVSIDYKYNNFNGTFWEMWEDSEVDSDLISEYVFKYLYETK